MLIGFFNKHSKLLVVMVILALFGIWSIIGNLVRFVVQLQHCDVFSSEGMMSLTSLMCYIFGQG